MSSKFVLQQEDGTVAGGNARGEGAIDLQLERSASNGVASGRYSVISGGSANRNSGGLSTISGGFLNVATGGYNSIGGGQQNTTSTDYSTISGGQSNTASTNTHATVVGGYSNTASGLSSVAGGQGNTASGNFSVALGYQSTASGRTSFVVGDTGTKATSDYSVAFGERVSSNNVCEISQGARIQVDYDTSHHLAMLKADLSTQASAATGNIGSYNMSKAAYAAGAASYKFNVDYQIFIIGTSGTTTGVAKGDVFARSESFIATTGTWGGTAPSYPGITTPSVISTDTVGAITGAEVTYSLSGNNLVMDYVMPTFTGGGTVNARIFVSFKAINLTKYM